MSGFTQGLEQVQCRDSDRRPRPASAGAVQPLDGGQLASGVDAAARALRRGEMAVLVDGLDREADGRVVQAAELATPESVRFMATEARGLISVAMPSWRLAELEIPPMTASPDDPRGPEMHIGVDHRHAAGSGVSARDRATTIRALADEANRSGDFTRPGHVFPVACRDGGVLRQPGPTEGAMDLLELAGLDAAAVTCEIAGIDGEMTRFEALAGFAREHGLELVSMDELVARRSQGERLVERIAEARLPTAYGEFTAVGYREALGDHEHLAFMMGGPELQGGEAVRLHLACREGDVFRSLRCSCGRELDSALARIATEGAGVLVYLRRHGGNGLCPSAATQPDRASDGGGWLAPPGAGSDPGFDREAYAIGVQILADLGLDGLRHAEGGPAGPSGLEGYAVAPGREANGLAGRGSPRSAVAAGGWRQGTVASVKQEDQPNG